MQSMMALTFRRYTELQPKQIPNMSNLWIPYGMDFGNPSDQSFVNKSASLLEWMTAAIH